MWFADLKPSSPFFASFDLNSLVGSKPFRFAAESLRRDPQIALAAVSQACSITVLFLHLATCTVVSWIMLDLVGKSRFDRYSSCVVRMATHCDTRIWKRIVRHKWMGKPGKSWEHATHSFAQPEASNLKLQDLRSLVCLAVCRGRTCSCLKLRLVNPVCCSSFAQSDLACRFRRHTIIIYNH